MVRHILFLIYILCVFSQTLITPSYAELLDDQTGLADIRQCVESYIDTGIGALELNVIGAEKCIIRETENCLQSNNWGFQAELECLERDAKLWTMLQEEYLARLQEKITMSYAQLGDNPTPVLNALLSVHSKWQKAESMNCAYMSLRWGEGMERIVDNYRCGRNEAARQALLYREWLYDSEIAGFGRGE